MSDEKKKKLVPLVSRAFTWTAAGIAAAWGILVTISDPQTLDNVMNLRSRFLSYFEEENGSLIDRTSMKILVEGHIRQALDQTVEIPAKSKDELAAHLAVQCIKKADESRPAESETRLWNDVGTEDLRLTEINFPGVIGYCSYIVGFMAGAQKDTERSGNPDQVPLKIPLTEVPG